MATDHPTEVTDGEFDTVPTKDPNKVHVKKNNGSLPLDAPVAMSVVRHMDGDKGLIGHTLSLDIHRMGEVTVKIVRDKMFVILVDGEEVSRHKKKVT